MKQHKNMKKYLFTLAVVLMAVCSQALAQLTPMHRADLAKNERLMGLYTSDAWNETGKAVSSRNASYKVFTILPKERYEDYLDGKITAIRLALSEPCEVKNVFVWGVTARDELVPISETSAQEQTMTAGWNVVTLSEPLAIPTNFERLAIGYEFVQRPGIQSISLVEGYDEESFCLMATWARGRTHTTIRRRDCSPCRQSSALTICHPLMLSFATLRCHPGPSSPVLRWSTAI